MKYRIYLKMSMLFVFLSVVSFHLSSKVIETDTIVSQDSIRQEAIRPVAVTIEEPTDSLEQQVQTRACVNTYTNQTVTTYTGVEGCTTLAVQNVTVTNPGNLILWAPGEVTVTGPFDVNLGGQLEINLTKPQTEESFFIYDYDASGNRISRLLVPCSK